MENVNIQLRINAIAWWNKLSWTDRGNLMEGEFKHRHPQSLTGREIGILYKEIHKEQISMREKQILNNSIIAEFMGYKKELFYLLKQGDNWQEKDYGFYDLPFDGGMSVAGIDKIWFPQTELKFHSDWNWLMFVIEKIESLGYYISVMKSNVTCCKDRSISPIFEKYFDTNVSRQVKLETTWLAVVEFIKNYNQKK